MTNAAVGMPCPVCRVPLVMSERQGVEIDYCPQCAAAYGSTEASSTRSSSAAPERPQLLPPTRSTREPTIRATRTPTDTGSGKSRSSRSCSTDGPEVTSEASDRIEVLGQGDAVRRSQSCIMLGGIRMAICIISRAL